MIVLIPALLINTLYVCHNATGEGNLLTFLHEKYTPGIERFLLILLLPMSAYKVFGLLIDSPFFYGGLILLVVIFGAGLQLIALSWRNIERDALHRTTLRMTALTISVMCFTLVFLGELIPFEVRVVMIAMYSCISGWLAFKMDQPGTVPSLIMACVVPFVFVGWAFLRLNIIPAEFNRIIFNIPVLVLLLVGLFLCRKNETMRAYMIISISSYLFEYIN